jgi:zinc protease
MNEFEYQIAPAKARIEGQPHRGNSPRDPALGFACSRLRRALIPSANPRHPTARPLRRVAPTPRPIPESLFLVRAHELANGLRVRVVEDHTLPVVSFTTVFWVGSRNERPGATGIAHLFEHMMFNGAKKYGPGEFDRIIESEGGHSNAYTSTDVTVYHEEIPPSAVEKVIDLEADRMRSLEVTPEILETERKVVKEERLMRVDNDVAGMVIEELESLVFKSHPYRWPVIGWGPDLDAISRAECVSFFGTYYAPNNAAVWVVGDVDAEHVVDQIEKAYGDIPKGPPPPPVSIAEPPQKGERRAVVTHPAQSPFLAIAFPAPKASDDDALVLDVAQYALAEGDAARLPRRLIFEEELAVSVDASWGWRIDPGLFAFFAELKPKMDPRKPEQAIRDELDALARRDLSARELRRAKNLLRAHLLRELSTVGSRANILGTAEVLRHAYHDVPRWLERYASVTAADVRRVAQLTFDPDKLSAVILRPSGVDA